MGGAIAEVHYCELSHVTRKSVFRIFDKVRHNPACSATELSWSLEISDIETRSIILSRKQTTKALIRLHRCTGWSAPLLFAYGINRFSHDVAQITESCPKFSVLKLFISGKKTCSESWKPTRFTILVTVTAKLRDHWRQCYSCTCQLKRPSGALSLSVINTCRDTTVLAW